MLNHNLSNKLPQNITRRNQLSPMYGITNVGYGWQLRLGAYPASVSGFYYTQAFSASKYGGTDKALKAAKRRRNEILKTKAFKDYAQFHGTTKTGFYGVSASCGVQCDGILWASFQVRDPFEKKSHFYNAITDGVWDAYYKAVKHRAKIEGKKVRLTKIIEQYDSVFLKRWGPRFKALGINTKRGL